MAVQRILDSHTHFWPLETANEEGHAWMKQGMPLAKPHLLSDYYKASRQSLDTASDTVVEGVVYIETDVRYDTPSGNVAKWAKGPLDEIEFLRSVVEGKYDKRDSSTLLGLVPWAPMDQSPPVLEEYLRLAEEGAGPETWKRVKGFRYLLQFIQDETKFRDLVLGNDFIRNLKALGKRGFSFDIGVDQRSGGVWQLEAAALAIFKAQEDVPDDEKVLFIVNHLAKPDFPRQRSEFDRWCAAIEAISQSPTTYMKLSGGFSELPTGLTEANDIADHLRPWLKHIMKCFGPSRIMFGSDWPVCNVNGPLKEDSWSSWKDVVKQILEDPTYGLDAADKNRIWRGTAREVYRLP